MKKIFIQKTTLFQTPLGFRYTSPIVIISVCFTKNQIKKEKNKQKNQNLKIPISLIEIGEQFGEDKHWENRFKMRSAW